MEYFALFVLAVLGHTASGKSWGGHDFHRPMGSHHHPTANHDNFNYNTWCHSAGGWDGNHSWEDSNSNESPEWNGDKSRPLRAGAWDRNDSWEDSSSEEWDYYKNRPIRAGKWDNSEYSEDSSSKESQEWNDGKERLIRSTTTRRSVVINKTQTEGTSSISIRLSSTGSTPSPLEVLLCLRMCSITPEYNPVCGTDNITYWNHGRLQCAMTCGINVALKNPSACPPTKLDTSEPNSPVTNLSPQVLATCMRSCSVTSEYNPVCGTDNITYNNPSRLECAKGCGKPVSMLLPSRCPPPDQLTSTTTISPQVLATCMRSCPVTSEYNPVCGTDSITYNNPSRLECVKGCGKPVSMLLPSRCPSPDQLTSTTTTTRTPASIPSTPTTPMTPTSSVRTTSPNPGPTPTAGPTTRFTVAQNILDAIFNGDNSTTESVPDFSFDERFED